MPSNDAHSYFFCNRPNMAEIRYYFGDQATYDRRRAEWFAERGEEPKFSTYCSLCQNTGFMYGNPTQPPCPLPHTFAGESARWPK